MNKIQITGIHMEQGRNELKHIGELRWVDPAVGIVGLLDGAGVCSREMLVDWLQITGNSAFTKDEKTGVTAEVKPHPKVNPFYVRTNPDDEKQDNLLYLDQDWPYGSRHTYILP